MEDLMRAVRPLVVLACLAVITPAGAATPRDPIPCPADLGAGVEEACPCDGPDGVEPWKSHGRYVRCVARYRNALRRAGCAAATDLREVMRCAARSTCGKVTAVVCCFYDEGTCTDPEPDDGEPAGFCSNDTLRASTAIQRARRCGRHHTCAMSGRRPGDHVQATRPEFNLAVGLATTA
jgi:hypothetical protein